MTDLDTPEGARELTRALELLDERRAGVARPRPRRRPAVRAEVERVARAWCRREDVISLCGHALVEARK